MAGENAGENKEGGGDGRSPKTADAGAEAKSVAFDGGGSRLSRGATLAVAIIAVLALAALAGARVAWYMGAYPWQQPQYGDVAVSVADGDGDPISGCSVSVVTTRPSVSSPATEGQVAISTGTTDGKGSATIRGQLAGQARLDVYCTPKTDDDTTCMKGYDACVGGSGSTGLVASYDRGASLRSERIVTVTDGILNAYDVTVDEWSA